MKAYTKVVLLVALALFLTLTACTRMATTKAPGIPPTATGEAPFPFTTPSTPVAGVGGVAEFGTQTAVAKTPQVLVATNTPSGQEVNPPAAEATEKPETGGGIIVPTQAAAAPAAPAQAVNTPVVQRPENYILQKGEWPICIARRYNLDISTFFAVNGLNMDSKPSAGRSLKIPSSGSWSSNYGNRTLAPHPTTYTVKGGDTVNSIACQFGDVTPEAILAVNSLGSASDVKAGMTLQIP